MRAGCPRDAGAKVHGQHVRIHVDAQVFSDHRADMPGDAIDTHVFGKVFGAQAAGFGQERDHIVQESLEVWCPGARCPQERLVAMFRQDL